MSAPNGPIADLSYRNYDGPKSIDGLRWWPIAKNGIRGAMRKKFFWVLVALAMLPYLFLIIQMIVLNAITSQGDDEVTRNLPTFIQMLAGAYGNTVWVMFVALLVGTGSIAADNRANALQVYLSKPITRRDYVIGKLMSVFVPVYAVSLLPMLIATSFAAFDQGVVSFFQDHPSLYFKLFVLAAVPAIAHSSLICGLSAWNKTPWMVGVIYVAIYFFWNAVSMIASFAMRNQIGDEAAITLRFFSIDGAISGLGYRIIGSMPGQGFGAARDVFPAPLPLFALLAAFVILGVFLCYSRVRAVEVISG